jgi:hypothetical protein
MPPKEKEEVPEVWTTKWGVKIREPQEMTDTMATFVIETTEKVCATASSIPTLSESLLAGMTDCVHSTSRVHSPSLHRCDAHPSPRRQHVSRVPSATG